MTDTEGSFALIGATGGMGAPIADEFANRRIPFRVIARHPDLVSDRHGQSVVAGNASNADELAAALIGTTTLISAFNPGWGAPDLYNQYLSGSWSILRAAEQAGVRRVLIIGGAASLVGTDGQELLSHGLPPEPYGSGVRAARDLLHQLRASADLDLDWVFLSPPPNCGPVGPTERTGTYRRGTDHPVVDDQGNSSLSVPDLAVAAVDEVMHPQVHNARFTVGY